MRRACDSLLQLRGNEADEYAREHLIEGAVDLVNWTVGYSCPDTGRLWLRDSPHSELHGGGPPRRRQLDAAGEPLDEPGRDPFR
jgi:hypothetical protein